MGDWSIGRRRGRRSFDPDWIIASGRENHIRRLCDFWIVHEIRTALDWCGDTFQGAGI